MKFSEQWLREWVDIAASSEELASQLSMAGLEVAEVVPVAADFTGVVVGSVTAVAPHPNADRLRVCQVKVTENELLQIICGASNVQQGLKVAVALEGANLPNGLKIRNAKLRGVESQGMICSSSELGLTATSSGIMELPASAPVGQDFRNYYKLDDHIFEIELTPNRGDCLSIMGIAREVAALNSISMKEPFRAKLKPSGRENFKVTLQASKECPRYLCRIIRGIDPTVATPLWLQEKLRRCGLGTVSAVVDVANYVMLELGQPLHAFDLKRIDQEIIVRMAQTGESITLLNGAEVELRADTLVIADHNKPLALAGIMGGLDSAINDHTSDILLESAFFTPEAIAGRARSYGLHTDSSHRFERGVDPELPRRAMERVTELLLEIVGGRAAPITETVAAKHLPTQKIINLRQARINQILGVEIPAKIITKKLSGLGLAVKKIAGGWQVTVPSSRFDLALEVDLIEEVARLYGYNNIPELPPSSKLQSRAVPVYESKLLQMRQFLTACGYNEIISYSFTDAKLLQQLEPKLEPLLLVNPISPELAAMRTTIWAGLLTTLLYNQRRQHEDLRLFEVGLCFRQDRQGLQQQPYLGGLVTGSLYPEQWGVPTAPVDFFAVKGELENLLARIIEMAKISFVSEQHPALKPGCCAAVYYERTLIGYIGALHPRLQKVLGLKKETYLFDLNLTFIYNTVVPIFKEISKFPQIRRDLALVVDQEVSAEKIVTQVWGIGNKTLRSVEIFDIYRGAEIAQGKKSVALKLLFQHETKTLEDKEVDKAVSKIVERLQQRVNAVLRG